MAGKKVLLLPGDDPGTEMMDIAMSVMDLLVPDLEFLHADIGRTAWEYTNEVLPPDTEDAIAEADVILCGPVDVRDLGKKDPVDTIILYNNLYMQATEFIRLKYISSRELDTCIVTPVESVTRQISELESLDGVDATYSTVAEDTQRFFRKCIDLARIRGKSEMTHVSPSDIMPHSARFSESVFRECMSDCSIIPHTMNYSEAAEALANKPISLGMMVGGGIVGNGLRGIAYGLSNCRGLTGDAYIGDNLSLYTIGRDIPANRRNNPTATLHSVACLLSDLGYVLEGKTLVAGIKDLYAERTTTMDVTYGQLTAAEFGKCLIEWLNSN